MDAAHRPADAARETTSDRPGPESAPLPALGTPAVPGLTSVIIPCWNQLAFTRLCISALLRHTRGPWELIGVDNASTDGTAGYFAGLRAIVPVRVEVITNSTNLGFPAACNQGLRCARGEFIVFLNNDSVVTDGWHEQLIALTKAGPSAVGPMSNYVLPPQLIPRVGYRDLDGMHQFAAQLRAAHRGQWFTASKLSGFCLLARRELFERIGGMCESYGLGFFDDDDLAVRARQAGLTLAVAADLFIHHFGSRSFQAGGIDTEALLAENERRFRARWGDAAPVGQRVTLSPWNGHGSDSR